MSSFNSSLLSFMYLSFDWNVAFAVLFLLILPWWFDRLPGQAVAMSSGGTSPLCQAPLSVSSNCSLRPHDSYSALCLSSRLYKHGAKV